MKVITWNIRKAKEQSQVWEILESYNADIILLQEVLRIPHHLYSTYNVIFRHAISESGKQQIFGTAILTKYKIKQEINLKSNNEFIQQELDFFKGNLISIELVTPSNKQINVISIYSPAWSIPESHYAGIDIGEIKLKQNKRIWATEILFAYLREQNITHEAYWILGGDLNSSETFDYLWAGGPHGNLEIIQRFELLGFKECLRHFNNGLVPTFRNPKGGKIIHQIDHLYISDNRINSLSECMTENHELIFGNQLSDHLPIISSFSE
jgi:exonuclease III